MNVCEILGGKSVLAGQAVQIGHGRIADHIRVPVIFLHQQYHVPERWVGPIRPATWGRVRVWVGSWGGRGVGVIGCWSLLRMKQRQGEPPTASVPEALKDAPFPGM